MAAGDQMNTTPAAFIEHAAEFGYNEQQSCSPGLFEQMVARDLAAAIRSRTWPPTRPCLPINPATGRRYHGINALALMLRDSPDGRWLSEEQLKRGGGGVRAGQAPAIIMTTGVPTPSIAPVYNCNQARNPPPLAERVNPLSPRQRVWDIILSTPAEITAAHESFFNHKSDQLFSGPRPADNDEWAFNIVHHILHWTGGYGRLGREIRHPRGSTCYAREALIVQIARLILAAELGYSTLGPDIEQYHGMWANILTREPNALIDLALQAEAALAYLDRPQIDESPIVNAMRTTNQPVLLISYQAVVIECMGSGMTLAEARTAAATFLREEHKYHADTEVTARPEAHDPLIWAAVTADPRIDIDNERDFVFSDRTWDALATMIVGPSKAGEESPINILTRQRGRQSHDWRRARHSVRMDRYPRNAWKALRSIAVDGAPVLKRPKPANAQHIIQVSEFSRETWRGLAHQSLEDHMKTLRFEPEIDVPTVRMTSRQILIAKRLEARDAPADALRTALILQRRLAEVVDPDITAELSAWDHSLLQGLASGLHPAEAIARTEEIADRLTEDPRLGIGLNGYESIYANTLEAGASVDAAIARSRCYLETVMALDDAARQEEIAIAA